MLMILAEEASEVIQLVSKSYRFGFYETHLKSGMTNRDRLTEELGDLQCMIDLLTENDIIDIHHLRKSAERKRFKLQQWSNLFRNDNTPI